MASTLRGLQGVLNVPHEILLIHDDKEEPALPFVKPIQAKDASMQILLNACLPGVAGAIRTGLERARGQYVLFLVADDQGPLAIINPMLDLMRRGYDVVSGTRYAGSGGVSGGGFWANAASAWGNRTFGLLASSQFSDATCGIKMFRKEILQGAPFNAGAGWAVVFELAVRAERQGLKVAEIPYVSYNRVEGGMSHFKIGPRMLGYGKIFLREAVNLRFRKTHA
ncbi:MAG: glycosyltransferase [Candidatus Omnitrophica bacterium]|nr:glycosyltransferase [Candidatus Omnitrophota bacterium]MDE2009556.1 glycosyltransferase [Candidatus Omnitrophota bacterium]MDE2231677.1 glycosyltransferase [Candidatus Omnitrophota bacterium]